MPLIASMFMKFLTQVDLCSLVTASSHDKVAATTVLMSRLKPAVRGIILPWRSKILISFDTTCLLLSFLGTKLFMSSNDLKSPSKILVPMASLPLVTLPKWRGWILSSIASMMGVHAMPATPTTPSSDISGLGWCPVFPHPLISAPREANSLSVAS